VTESVSGEMNNPPEAWLVRLYLLVALALLCVALVAYVTSGMILPVLIACLPLPAIPILAVWCREYYRRPVSLEINEGGFLLRFRFKSERFVRWGEITGIYRERGNPSTPRGRRMRSGGLHLKGSSISYPLTYEVASSVWSAYVEQTGTAPPIWDGTY
jgi:hypothetical protein